MAEVTHADGYAVTGLDQTMGRSEAIVVLAGGKDGYVGRDGQAVGDNPRGGPPGAGA